MCNNATKHECFKLEMRKNRSDVFPLEFSVFVVVSQHVSNSKRNHSTKNFKCMGFKSSKVLWLQYSESRKHWWNYLPMRKWTFVEDQIVAHWKFQRLQWVYFTNKNDRKRRRLKPFCHRSYSQHNINEDELKRCIPVRIQYVLLLLIISKASNTFLYVILWINMSSSPIPNKIIRQRILKAWDLNPAKFNGYQIIKAEKTSEITYMNAAEDM